MCEAIVLCETGDDETRHENIPEGRNFTLYHLQTRTFWSQMSTIWEWFITNFDSASLAAEGHTRPVRVYTVKETHWSAPEIIMAHLSLNPATITIGDHEIDRIERHWLQGPTQQPIGSCQRMPLWESLEIIARKSPIEETP